MFRRSLNVLAYYNRMPLTRSLLTGKSDVFFPKSISLTPASSVPQSFASIIEKMKYNKEVAHFFSHSTVASVRARQLLADIKLGNAKSDVFKDEQVHLYLLELYRDKAISLEECMTAYMYYSALMEYTSSHTMRNEDELHKNKRKVCVDSFSENGEISKAGLDYVHTLVRRLRYYGFEHFDQEKFKNKAMKLPPTEQWMLRIHFPGACQDRVHDLTADRLMYVLIHNLPYWVNNLKIHNLPLSKYQKDNFYWAPSISMTKLIMQQLFDKPMEFHFVFGVHTVEETLQLHAQNKHPVALYCKEDEKNLVVADAHRVGPYSGMAHDIHHAFLGSILHLSEREFLFQHLLPRLMKYQQALQKLDPMLASLIASFVDKADAFDLTPFEAFSKSVSPFNMYLDRLFDVVCLSYDTHSRKKIGQEPDERFVYLLLRLQQQAITQEDRDWYRSLLSSKFNLVKYAEHPGMFVLKGLAKTGLVESADIKNAKNIDPLDWAGLIELEKADLLNVEHVRSKIR